MTTIFSQVTAEIASDLEQKFPNDFDFPSMIEKVSEDAGVVLQSSEQQYKLQGLWVSMEKAYGLLATTLGVYGARISAIDDITIEVTNTRNDPLLQHGTEVNTELSDSTDTTRTNATTQSTISAITSRPSDSGRSCKNKSVNSKRQTKVSKVTKNAPEPLQNSNNKNVATEAPSRPTRTRSQRLCTNSNTDNKLDNKDTNKKTIHLTVNEHKKRKSKVQLLRKNSQIKSIKQKTLASNQAKSPVEITNSNNNKLTEGVKKRKRGRPKKSITTTSANLLKQKIYKYTKYKPNFVRRPFVVRPVVNTEPISDNNQDSISLDENIKSEDCYEEDSDEDFNENDIDYKNDDDAVEIDKKPKRGRPKRTGEEKKFPCSDCDFVAVNGNMLSDHKHRTHKACPTKCDVCNKVFPNKRYMMRHRSSHVEPQHCCDICGKMYKVKKSMQDHRKTHEIGYTKPVFDCSQCSKTFCNGYILKCHIKSEHLGEKKSFLCSRCGKSFTTKHSLQEHSNAHSGLKPHVCDVCGKGFNYESALRDHKYTHTESRKFSCSVCNKYFCQRSSLKMHMRIHAVEKKFVCEECGRGFTQKQALQRHERVHKGFKPFVCKLCRRTFTDSSIIRRHLILVHKIHKDSNSWREDIVCKIGPTKFRVEKLDSSKQEIEEDIADVVEELPMFHTQTVEHSYSVKDGLDNEIDQNEGIIEESLPSTNANAPNLLQDSCNRNLLIPSLPSCTQTLELPQVIDYSDRNTSSVTSMHSSHSHGMITEEQQSNLSDDRLVNSHTTLPLLPISTTAHWTLPTHNHVQAVQNHSQPHHLHIPPSNHMQQEISNPIEHSSNDTRDYPPQQDGHLPRSATPQYLAIHDVDNQMRCSSVNYPTDIRHHELPPDPNNPSSTQGQWPSIYAYYSQLASQFGMNLNEYPSNGYTCVQPQEGSHPQAQQHQQQL